jgi:hypothetical protein
MLIGAIAGTAFLGLGAAFLYGIADMGWPYSLFNVFWFLWLLGIPAVPVASAWWTYRRVRGKIQT